MKIIKEKLRPPTTGGGMQSLFNIYILLVKKFPSKDRIIDNIKVATIFKSSEIIFNPPY